MDPIHELRTAQLNALPAPLTSDTVLSNEQNFLTVVKFSPSTGVVAVQA